MSKTMRVSRIADWAGWCSPCEREDRPLVLTRSGRLGVASWLAGVSDEDRILLLTCRVCGSWQYVPLHEEDDPEIVLVEDDVFESVAEIVHAGRVEQPAEPVRAATPPAQRAPEPTPEPSVEIVAEVPTSIQRDLPAAPPREMTYDARATAVPLELGVVAPPPLVLPVPRDEVTGELVDVPVADAPVPTVEPSPSYAPVEAPVAEAPVAVPAPRAAAAVQRIVTVPEPESVTAPGFSPEAVAAAAAVLAAARGQAEAPAADRRTVAERRRTARRGPTPRRSADRVAAVRAAAAAEAAAGTAPALEQPVELPAVLGLPAGTHQLVLAVAS